MEYLQDNILASSNLITSSMVELNRAISAAGTTLDNAINAFNQLNYTRFFENVSKVARRQLARLTPFLAAADRRGS